MSDKKQMTPEKLAAYRIYASRIEYLFENAKQTANFAIPGSGLSIILTLFSDRGSPIRQAAFGIAIACIAISILSLGMLYLAIRRRRALSRELEQYRSTGTPP